MDYQETTNYTEFQMDFSAAFNNPTLNTGRIALMDADFIIYLVTSRIFNEIKANSEKGRMEIFLKEDPAIKNTKNIVDDFFRKIKDPIIFCFSGNSRQTFRANLAFDKVYKGNRKKDYSEYEGKLQDITTVLSYIKDNYMTLAYPDLEADDIVSALQDLDNTYIISKDKDLKQVPGMHYDFSTNKLNEITFEQAAYNLAYQLLVGDTTDNISGLPKCGEKGAIKILSECKPQQYIKRVLHEYQMKFGFFNGSDMFAETFLLVKLRGNRGNNFVTKYKGMFDLKESILNEIKKQKT